jgi:4-hydroxy-tetrahydrodipicolinate synthase
MTFDGVRPVIHLPFAAGPGEPIVQAELAALVQHVVREGADGVVALGLASEAGALSEAERDEELATVAAALGGRVPLVVGIDGPTAVAVARARRAAAFGAAGVMVLPPAAAGPVDQMVAHFSAIADGAGLAVMVQDSPQVTGVQLPVQTLLALHRAHQLVATVKVEVGGAGAKVSALIAAGMAVVAGWGGLHYPESLRRGAIGVMPGCDLAPALGAIHRAGLDGEAATVERLYGAILPYLCYEAQSLELLVLGAKRHLVREGIFSSGRLRAPGRGLDPIEAATLDDLHERLAAADVPGFAGLTV